MDVVRDCSPNRPKLCKISDRHPKSILELINQLRRSNELCDVCLRVGNSKIYAHKIILSASSPYFRAMFTGELVESRQDEITIKDIDETAIEMLIDFCYSSKITIDEKSVQTLLPAACILQLQEVQDYCSEFLRSQLDPSNCLGIRAFADTHSCIELIKIADKYIQNNFVDVIECDEYLLLPLNQLVGIVSADELNVKNEEQVYQAVMNWISHDAFNRKSYLGHLMNHVRLPLLDTKFLVTRVGNDPLIKQDQLCRDLIDEAKDYHLLPLDRPSMQGPRTKPRRPFIMREILFAVGGWCSGDAISSVEIFDPQKPVNNEWKIVTAMSKRRCGVGVAVLNQNIYAIGGHDGQSYLNSVERYDPQTNQWYMDVQPTSSCRTSVGVAVLDDTIYAVGGQDGVSCLSFVEKYDVMTNRWSRVASMSSKRLGVAVCVLDSKLYAIGGSDGTSPLNSVERYDPKINKWSLVAPMLTKRKHLGCVIYKNFIYAVGGRDDMTELNTAERYNPTLNLWTPIVSMKSRRSGVGLTVISGKIYAIGGFDGATYLKSVEVFDPETNVWKISSSMIYRRLGGGVGVIKIQRDSILFKTTLKVSAESKGSKASSSSVAVVPSPILAPQSQRAQVASSSNQITVQSNSTTAWPYAIQSLPSLLANVPVPSSFTASSSFTEHTNGVISTSSQAEVTQSEASDILTVNQASSSIQPSTSNGVTSESRQQAANSNNLRNSSACKLLDI